MIRHTIAYAVTAVVFLGVDYIWLNRAMGFYGIHWGICWRRSRISSAAATFYLIYFLGIVVFAVIPQPGMRMDFGIVLGWSARAGRVCDLRSDQSCNVRPLASRLSPSSIWFGERLSRPCHPWPASLRSVPLAPIE